MRRKSELFEDDLGKTRRRKRRGSRWFLRWVALFGLAGIALVASAPWIASSPSMVNSAIQRFGGLEPLKATVGDVSIGWLSPASVGNLELRDEAGNLLVSVRRVQTGKGILGWIRSTRELGTIGIEGVEADIVTSSGTTNLEQALAGFLKFEEPQEDEGSESNVALAGTISITDAKFRLREHGRPEQWLVEVPTLHAILPNAKQLIGPIELKAQVTSNSQNDSNSIGQIVAKAEQTADGAIELRARLDNLPLEIWHAIRARVPDIPVLGLSGVASGVLAGNAVDVENWTFDIQQIQVQNFAMSAPDLIGNEPAQLANIAAGGRVSLANQLLQLQDTQLVCDVGNVRASASIPWPVTLPNATNPFIDGATVAANGTVDLPQLVRASQSLLPMREDIQLVSGRMQFSATQRPSAANPQESRVQMTVSDLQARSTEGNITWQEPLTVELKADQQPSGTVYAIGAKAEFCDVQGSGTIENGNLAGNVNLDLLHRRLSQFMELPITAMNGAAELNVHWSLNEGDQVAATGTLQTTPLLIATPTGGEMREPAWKGDFSASATVQNGTPKQINRAHLELNATDEQLVVDLHEPIQLATEEGSALLPPAPFNISVAGDLAGWKRRGFVWLSEPPDVDVHGNIQLAVSGRMDTSHVEVLQANWESTPVALRTADFAFAEPRMVGNFKGRIDTTDLTRLQVDQLTVQANSFWVVAQDEASDGGQTRSGQARWLLDVQRLLDNLNSANASGFATSNSRPSRSTPTARLAASSSAAPSSAYSGSGTLQGGLQWRVGDTGAAFALQANGENVAVHSQSPSSPQPTVLWSEPTIALGLTGQWAKADGSVDVQSVQVQAPWLSYQGNLSYRSNELASEIVSEGQANYDAAQLTARLEPMLGKNIQLMGQQNVPIQVRWRRDASTAESVPALAGLDANARLGWQQARVIGIEVGQADVPVTISRGRLATAAEIPVSGGMLRWDITSDLTQDLLVIEQKPMTVLENVAITREMCSGWLKYVAPLVADATSIDGRLSLSLDQATLSPTDLTKQTVAGRLSVHRAAVGPGPIVNEITGLVKQIEAIRNSTDPNQVAATDPNKTWMQLPEQQISFQMVEGRVHHRDLKMDIGDAVLLTSGSVDVAGTLGMVVALPLPEAWTSRGPVLAAMKGQTLQFPVRGTVTRPQLDASLLGQFGRQTIQNAAQNLLQEGLNKGLEKLFK